MDKCVRFNRNFLFVTAGDDSGSDLSPQVSDSSCPLLLIIQKQRRNSGSELNESASSAPCKYESCDPLCDNKRRKWPINSFSSNVSLRFG